MADHELVVTGVTNDFRGHRHPPGAASVFRGRGGAPLDFRPGPTLEGATVLSKLRHRLRRGPSPKESAELGFWRDRLAAEGTLGNAHYERLFTEMFDVPRSFFSGKRILDLGCGPRGSLEWATDARTRVGLDPLADRYRELGTGQHSMRYVNASAEDMPFDDASFDVVTSLNSLDHVDDLDSVLREIGRVTAPGGSFLLEVETGHDPTPSEPISVDADVLDRLAPWFEATGQRHFEMPGDHFVHDAYWRGGPYDTSRERHPGVLVAHLVRRAVSCG